MAVMGEQMEAASNVTDVPVAESDDVPSSPVTHPDYLPEPLFKGHNVANNRIGVFTGIYMIFF